MAIGVGDTPCNRYDGARQPLISFDTRVGESQDGRVEIGEDFFICFYGFARSRSLTVRVSTPTGRTRTYVEPAGGYAIAWRAAPGAELGSYRVTASQGGRTVVAAFSVGRATRPHLLVLDGGRRLGRPVRIALAGFPGRRAVVLDFYRTRRPNDGGEAVRVRYVNSVRVRTRGDGTSVYRLPTSRLDAEGTYVVVPRLGQRQLRLRDQFALWRR